MKLSDNSSNWVQNIVSNCLCTGCGLCQSINSGTKISVELDSNGYFRPTIIKSTSLEDKAMLNTTCPGVHLEHNSQERNNHYDMLWGPLLQMRLGYAIDPEIRFLGSSGGVISALAVYLLQSGKVDYVLHTVASPSKPLLNITQMSRSRSDVLEASGSRYSPSSPLINLESYLVRPETFAFIGKPCDVAALYNYAKLDARVGEKMLYSISFMCAGVPSLRGTIALLKQVGLKEEEVKSIRYRGQGWPGPLVVETINGQSHSMDYKTSWGFLSKYLQFRCKICPDGIGEFSDISCGDAWYLKDGKPDFSEREGRNVIMSRTARGEQLIQDSILAGHLTVMLMNGCELPAMQPYQAIRKKIVTSRLCALKVLGVRTPKYVNLQVEMVDRLTSIPVKLKSFLGTLVRVLLRLSFETPQLNGIWKMISRMLSRFVRSQQDW